jgi:hypothetical protein
VETALQVSVHIVKSSGCDFIHSIVDEDSGQEFSGRAETYPPYEI